MIKVLLVDDAAVVRIAMRKALTAEPGFEVVGAARNGRIALDLVKDLSPDIVLLDVEMPVMDGLQALEELRKSGFSAPVIMFSSLTEQGASRTLRALALGASDYVTKPGATGGGSLDEVVKHKLVPKIRALCGAPDPAQTAPAPLPKTRPRRRRPHTIDIVAIGSSTGGPNALSRVMSDLGEDFEVPVVITQHMPPVFTRHLAERLDRESSLRVSEGQPGDLIQPGHAFLAPGDYHMVVERKQGAVRLATNQGPRESSCRPAVDPMLRSVIDVYGGNVLAVILTGMGSDGLLGCRLAESAGARIIAQDEASSVVWGMPRFVAEEGLAEAVLPLNEIGRTIARWTRERPRAKSPRD